MPPPSCTGIPTRARIASTAAALRGAPGEGAVQIDHMEPGETLPLEGRGLRGRIVAEDLGLGHVTLDETDAASLLEVDRRVEDHGFVCPSGRGRNALTGARPENSR